MGFFGETSPKNVCFFKKKWRIEKISTIAKSHFEEYVSQHCLLLFKAPTFLFGCEQIKRINVSSMDLQ
jgi:hypothetical protein